MPRKGVEGTSTFKAPGRKPFFSEEETPGPQSYIKPKELDKKSGANHPF